MLEFPATPVMWKRVLALFPPVSRNSRWGKILNMNSRFFHDVPAMKPKAYESRVDAEPTQRYRFGGYHLINLGDFLGIGGTRSVINLDMGAIRLCCW